MTRRPPSSTLFPYTTLSRSLAERRALMRQQRVFERRPLSACNRTSRCRNRALQNLPPGADDRVPASCSRAAGSSLESVASRSEEHTSELQSRLHLVCRLLLE